MATEHAWKFKDTTFDAEGRLLIQVLVHNSNWINIEVGESDKPGKEIVWKEELFNFFQSAKAVPGRHHPQVVSDILESCHHTFGDSLPRFCNTLYLRDVEGEPRVIEDLDAHLLAALPELDELFREGPVPPVTLISRSELQNVILKEGSFMAQTRPILLRNKVFVAKGPRSAEEAKSDLNELVNLHSLPSHHPNILPPPGEIVKVADNDSRICGFLVPYYKNGNVDSYARKLRNDGNLDLETQKSWFRELASALHFLIDAGTWHGDIKPDNILVKENRELVLIDMTRTYTTMAIASPEVRQVATITGVVKVPTSWPISKIEKSEIYSIGKTMFFLCEGIPMIDVYRDVDLQHGRSPITFETTSSTPTELQNMIIDCVRKEPSLRPSLNQLLLQLR